MRMRRAALEGAEVCRNMLATATCTRGVETAVLLHVHLGAHRHAFVTDKITTRLGGACRTHAVPPNKADIP